MPEKSKDELYMWQRYHFKPRLLHRFSGLRHIGSVNIMPRIAPPPLQLWTAVKLSGVFTTMDEWFRHTAVKKIKLVTATTPTTPATTKGLDISCFPFVRKKATTSMIPPLSTFQVAILPTKQQRRV
jgi:hypothetical protein